MSWREASPVDQRTQFIADHLRAVAVASGREPAVRSTALSGMSRHDITHLRQPRKA